MRCEEMAERIPELLGGELDPAAVAELRAHLATCPGCAAEAAAFERLWDELGAAAEGTPGTELRERFERRLAAEIARERRRVIPFLARRAAARGGRWWGLPATQLAALAATLVVGVFVGSELSRRRDASAMAALRDDVRSLRETVTLALLGESSASGRLRGVAYGREASEGDDRVAGALFEAMLADPDVNVRLAALDALKPRAARPEERPRLIAAVARQDSPLVQLSLIDLLLESGAPAAQRDLEQLLDNPNLDPVVRGYLRDRIGRSL